MSCSITTNNNSNTKIIKSPPASSPSSIGQERLGSNLRTTENRLQSLENLVALVGNHLTKINWNLSDQQAAFVFKHLKETKALKNREGDESASEAHKLHRLALIEAMKYWRNQFSLFPSLDPSTSSGRIMEKIYKGYFTEFDPYHIWLTPNQFFNTVVTNRPQSLLGPATTTLILRIMSLTATRDKQSVESLYRQCMHITQSNIPTIYSHPSSDNTLALLFMGMNCMSYNDMQGFYKYYTMASRMAIILDLENTKDMWTIIPENDPNREIRLRESHIFQAIYYLDSFLSIIHNLPRQFSHSDNWEKNINPSNIIKYITLTPFYAIPVSPPRLISSFSTLTPALDEVTILSFHIVNRVKILQEQYISISSYKDIPVQEIFFSFSDYQELTQVSKEISNKLINIYTTDLMKEFLQDTADHKNLTTLIRHITHAVILIIAYHYPHIYFYPQPAIMPPSYIPRILKAVDHLLQIYSDFYQLSDKNQLSRQPFKFDGLWYSLFACLNISLQTPSNRVHCLIKSIIQLLINNHQNQCASYSISDLEEYLKRFGHEKCLYID